MFTLALYNLQSSVFLLLLQCDKLVVCSCTSIGRLFVHVVKTPLKINLACSPWSKVLVIISTGMWAVHLCSGTIPVPYM